MNITEHIEDLKTVFAHMNEALYLIRTIEEDMGLVRIQTVERCRFDIKLSRARLSRGEQLHFLLQMDLMFRDWPARDIALFEWWCASNTRDIKARRANAHTTFAPANSV